ncbi:MAG: trigger factor [Puniceicoccales bacterium]|jgi:trigger factor|nr:trigger factor [Puniceicoccales bacterium]
MKVIIEPIRSVLKKVVATLDAATCLKFKQNVLKKVQTNAVMPGFRKGKVPLDILNRRYADIIADEVKQVLLNEVVEYLKSTEKLEIASLAKADFEDAGDGQQMVSLEVEVTPEITLPDYKNFLLEEDNMQVKDEEVRDFIAHLQKQQATYEVVHREANIRDYVKIAYEGICEGEPVDNFKDVPHAWRKQKSTWEEVGNGMAAGVPEIIDGIVGMKVGDKKNIKVLFPENFAVHALRGKEGCYAVEMQEVREVKMPAMDETFFKHYQVQNLDELNDFARKTLVERKRQAYAGRQKQRISEFLIQSVTCDLPPSWVKREAEKVLQEMVDLFATHGVKNALLEEQKESVIQKAQSIAEDRVKLNLCFEKIAAQEKLQLEGKDIEPVLIQEAMQRRIPAQKMLQMVQKNSQLRQEIQQKATQAKLINWLFCYLENQQKNIEKKKD